MEGTLLDMMDAVQYDLPKPAKDDAGKVEEQTDTETKDVATTLVRDTLQAHPLSSCYSKIPVDQRNWIFSKRHVLLSTRPPVRNNK